MYDTEIQNIESNNNLLSIYVHLALVKEKCIRESKLMLDRSTEIIHVDEMCW